MAKTTKTKKITRGSEGFWNEYRSLFESETAFLSWKKAILTPSVPILRIVRGSEQRLKTLWDQAGITWQPLDWYPGALLWPPEIPAQTPLPGADEHLFYPMNSSSLLPVMALDPKPGETILDACSAPGGKLLMIAEAMNDTGVLVANDLSSARIRRLREILQTFPHTNTHISQKDATLFFRDFPETFDRILVDAPCSSEKHVASSAKHLALWSPARIKQLKQRQIALLCGLSLCLKPGGRMVYATCATTPEENEAVVAHVLKKRAGHLALIEADIPFRDARGLEQPFDDSHIASSVRRIWPTHHPGMDPMFVAVFEAVVQ